METSVTKQIKDKTVYYPQILQANIPLASPEEDVANWLLRAKCSCYDNKPSISV